MPNSLARLAAATSLALAPSLAAARCGERAAVLAFHAARFGEVPAARGVASAGCVAELLLAADGNWSLVMTCPLAGGAAPTHRTCLVATGEGWEPIVLQPPSGSTSSPPGRDT